jgi:hypothetical protein
VSALDPRQELEDLFFFCQRPVKRRRWIKRFESGAYREVERTFKEMEKMHKKNLPVPTMEQMRLLWFFYNAACRYLGREVEPFSARAMQAEWDELMRVYDCEE